MDRFAVLIMHLITYSLFGLCYFAFINTGISALRIRLLKELYDSNNGLTINELLICYNSKEIIDRRIKKLKGNKQITFNDNRYYTKKSVTLILVLIKETLSLMILRRKPRINLKQVIQYNLF